MLLVAHGTGPCDSFCLFHVDDADDLADIHPLDPVGANPAAEGKWSDLALSLDVRQLFKAVSGERMTRLDDYGTPELGTVTGSNDFFALSEVTRRKYAIHETHLKRISPPGTRHLKGLTFSRAQWEELKLSGDRVWLLHPDKNATSKGLSAYLAVGEERGVPQAYKCTVRDPWWRPPVVSAPDLFFTYMSHRYPRLIANAAGVTLVNSMHGVRLRDDAPADVREALAATGAQLGDDVGRRGHGPFVRGRHSQDGAARGRRPAGPGSRRAPRSLEGAQHAAPQPRRSAPARGVVVGRRRGRSRLAKGHARLCASTRSRRFATPRRSFASVGRGKLSRMAQPPKA